MSEDVRENVNPNEEISDEEVFSIFRKKSILDTAQSVEEAFANVFNRMANLEAENQTLKELLSQFKFERDLYKKLYEMESKMRDSALAALQISMDKMVMAFNQMMKSTIHTQELAVKYAETSITNQSLVNIIDQLRMMLSKYMPRSEVDRALDLLDMLMKRMRVIQMPIAVQTVPMVPPAKKGGEK